MKDTKLQVIKNIQIAKDTYLLQLSMPKDVQVSCGQFVNVQVPNRTHLILKRPLGICEYSNASFSVCYEIKGKGTNALTELKSGDNVVVTMPLGNGFVIKPTEQKVAIVGGGAGLFPLKSIFDSYKNKEFYSFLGFRDAEHSYFIDDFKANSKQTYISSNDGSIGEKDFVTNLLAKNLDVIKPDVILSCGPKPMYIVLKNVIQDTNIPTYVSLEERMGCGIGACLVCTCGIKKDGKVENKRVCKDGPVFDILKVVL